MSSYAYQIEKQQVRLDNNQVELDMIDDKIIFNYIMTNYSDI